MNKRNTVRLGCNNFLQKINYKVIYKSLIACVVITSSFSCSSKLEPGTFNHDLEILKNLEGVHILSSEESMIAVSPELQGRVFTSSSKGLNGKSYGWFKRDAFLDGTFKNHFGGLGGEDRMWFGPQYGKYNVFFEPGSTFEDEFMRLTPELDTLKFEVIKKTEKEVLSKGKMNVRNYQNFLFNVEMQRRVSILDKKTIEGNLGAELSSEVSYVGFETETKMTNIGAEDWSKESGLISIWILGCIVPTDSTVAIIPTRGQLDMVTNYFTPLDESRMRIKDGIVYYKADAKYLNKIGILPENTLPIFGTYAPELNLLTIVEFTFEDSPYYVNSQKEINDAPYAGDVINIFNDGITPTAGPFGPFYELESSSSAKELQVGQIITHKSKTYHFEGNEDDLDKIALATLGVKVSNRIQF